MAHVTKQISKQDITHFTMGMLENIYDRIKRKKIDLKKQENVFTIVLVLDETFSYCHEGIVAIQRGFKSLGWNCKMSHYERRENDETKIVKHGFAFTFTKEINPLSDLPF